VDRDVKAIVPAHLAHNGSRQVRVVARKLAAFAAGFEDEPVGRLHVDVHVQSQGKGKSVEAGAEVS
jgi:hypothetical protein